MTKHEITLKKFIDIGRIINGEVNSTILPELDIKKGDRIVFRSPRLIFKSSEISSDILSEEYTVIESKKIRVYWRGFCSIDDVLEKDFTYFEEQLSKDWGITAPDRRFKIDQIFDGDLIKYEYTTGLLIYWGTEEEYIQIDMSNQRDVVTELRKKLKEEEENLKSLEERRG